jgi:hypothetical protein
MRNKNVTQLLPLQQTDRKIYELEIKKRILPQKLEPLQKRYQGMQEELVRTKEEIKRLKLETSKKELSLKEIEEKIRQLTIKSNMVKKNEEFQAIMKEISSAKADKSLLEDEILNLYSWVEENENALGNFEKEFNQFAQELSQKERITQQDIIDIDHELERLRNQRKDVQQNIDPELLYQYERIISAKEDKLALVEAKDGVCQACMASLTSQEINLLMQGELVFCRSCLRILFLPDSYPEGTK